MCHASNTLWNVDEVDERSVEKPVAPGGATGGVEFEAMNYAVSIPEAVFLNVLTRRHATSSCSTRWRVIWRRRTCRKPSSCTTTSCSRAWIGFWW